MKGTSFACKMGLWEISFQSLFQTGFEGFRCFRAKWRGFIVLLSKASGVWWYWPDVMGEKLVPDGMSWQYNQPPSGLWWEKQMENRWNAVLHSTEDETICIIDRLTILVSSTKRNKANECKKIYNKQIERLIFGFTFLFWPSRKSSFLDTLARHKTYIKSRNFFFDMEAFMNLQYMPERNPGRSIKCTWKYLYVWLPHDDTDDK